jgi:hypothetical protein
MSALKIMRTVFCLSFLFLFAASSQCQETESSHKRFSNHDVIEMVKLGLSDDVIIEKIHAASSAGGNSLGFDTSVDGLKALKEAGVSDAVIKTMINPVPAPATTVVTTATPVTMDPSLPPPEVGVYWKNGTKFVRVDGQAVTNTKAGGKAGSFFTNGMRNQHWDATIAGPQSKNVVQERRPTFYFYVPDGSDSSDYVLISLNKKSDHREFQIGSFGGITGGKSGVKQDKEHAFHTDHVGIRIYKVTLDMDLKPGEYAFFMGTGQGNTMAGAHGGNRSGGAASGRVYDFSIPE